MDVSNMSAPSSHRVPGSFAVLSTALSTALWAAVVGTAGLLLAANVSLALQPGKAPAVGTPVKPASGAATSAKILELDWEELLPKETRLKFQGGPPAAVHDYLGEGGMAAQQIMDFSVNKELHGAQVKLPGFIVPLDIGKDGLVAEFFLVPYFGACIHVPPPPPNQIVYVRMAKGIALDSIYEAYWITGQLKVNNKATRLGSAAYQIDANKVEIYKY
jgi:uncharacterized protein